jgi:hypothetical protein
MRLPGRFKYPGTYLESLTWLRVVGRYGQALIVLSLVCHGGIVPLVVALLSLYHLYTIQSSKIDKRRHFADVVM